MSFIIDPAFGMSSDRRPSRFAPLNPALYCVSRIYSICPATASPTGIALRMNAPNIGTVNAVSP